jgi:hypothetical protein
MQAKKFGLENGTKGVYVGNKGSDWLKLIQTQEKLD